MQTIINTLALAATAAASHVEGITGSSKENELIVCFTFTSIKDKKSGKEK